jgi:hypothetical protein
MVGALVLARGVGGEDGERLLNDCRLFLHRALDDPRSTPSRE